jgi:hypothetical protein
MNTITEFSGGFISNVDNYATSIIDNKYAYITIVILVLLYGSLSASRLTKRTVNCLDNPICRLLFLGFLYYISTKNISLALIILASVVLSMCAVAKHKQNLIIVSMLRRKVTSHKKRRHRMRLLRKRKALKLKLLLKKIMIIMKRRNMILRRKLTPKVGKILDKATSMSKDLGYSTPKLVKQIKDKMNVPSSSVVSVPISVQASKDLITIPSESIERLVRFGQITQNDSDELSKLTREKLLTLIKSHEYSFINGNIIPENLIVKIVQRLRNQNNPRPVITGIPISSVPSTSPSSISSPSSVSSNSVSPNITLTNSSIPPLRR